MIRALLCLIVFATVIGAFLAPTYVFAADSAFSILDKNFSIVPQICGGTDEGECNACDFAQLINNLFKFLVFFATVVTTLMFMWAGFEMITAGESDTKRTKAKTMMWNVVIGFVFLLGSWTIVDTIMKAFLLNNGQLKVNNQFGPWNDIICPAGFQPTVGVAPVAGTSLDTSVGAGTGGGSLSGNSPISGKAGCPDCVDLTQNGFTCRIGSGGPCVASPAILTELKALKSGTSEDWIITAGYQPGQHAATCQSTYGTCVDAAFTDKNYSNVSRIVNFQKAASAAGCPAMFETGDAKLVNAVKNAGGNATVLPYAPHFSLYCNK
jgi:hypothetical protein